MDLPILYCDQALVVCQKPVGAVSEGTAQNAMPALLHAQLGGEIFPVHRLDCAVGGVMVYARTAAAAAALSRQIANHTLQKRYLAVLSALPQENAGVLEDLLFFDRRKNKSFVVRRLRSGVKPAKLSYTLFATAPDGAHTRALVGVQLYTGRTHQIRVQFASRKLPLLGDGKYGGGDRRCSVALWSHELCFCHPESGETRTFSCQPPQSFPWTLFEKN